jgi:hypothetical protein
MKQKKKAMLEMATAFGQGARYPWSTDAVTTGQDFLSKRFDKGKKDYWKDEIRIASHAKAREIGSLASDYAAADPKRPIVITDVHMALALSKRRILRGDCPFD